MKSSLLKSKVILLSHVKSGEFTGGLPSLMLTISRVASPCDCLLEHRAAGFQLLHHQMTHSKAGFHLEGGLVHTVRTQLKIHLYPHFLSLFRFCFFHIQAFIQNGTAGFNNLMFAPVRKQMESLKLASICRKNMILKLVETSVQLRLFHVECFVFLVCSCFCSEGKCSSLEKVNFYPRDQC